MTRQGARATRGGERSRLRTPLRDLGLLATFRNVW